MLSFIPARISHILEKAIGESDWDNLEEIRIYKRGAIVVNIKEKKSYISPEYKITDSGECYITDDDVLDDLVNILTGCSKYAYKESLGFGYLTARGGHRVGLTGTAVSSGDGSYMLKDISAANIRVSRDAPENSITDTSLKDALLWGTTAIISPPKCGKTTFLRRIAKEISSASVLTSVCIIDERGEICAVDKGVPLYNMGINVCVVNSMQKTDAFIMLTRNMSPEIIICDEITSSKEAEAIKNAVLSGVNVIFTLHGKNKAVLQEKSELSCLEGYIDSVVELSDRLGPGTVEKLERRRVQ